MYNLSTLPNHLRLITAPVSGVDSVTLLFLIGAGSRYERTDENGISHFAEHMFFKGTTKRPTVQDITKEIDGVGGVINAFTGEECTGFYVKVAAREFGRGLDVLSDMLVNASFAPEEIAKEKGVIVEEINMVNDQPQRKVFEVYKKTVYGETPLGRPVAGTKGVVTRLTRPDFMAYRNSLYTPDNAVLSIAGRLPKDANERVADAVSSWNGQRRRGAPRQQKTQKKPTVTILKRPSEQAHLILGVRTFQREHPMRYALALLNAIMGANMSSRLFLEVRERRGLAYAIHSSPESYADVGSWMVYAGVDLGKVADCVAVIRAELARVRDEPVTAEELNRAKAYVKGRLVLSFEDTEEVASFYGVQALLEREILTLDVLLRKIDAVTVADVQEVARLVMQSKNLNVAVLGKISQDQDKKIRKLNLF